MRPTIRFLSDDNRKKVFAEAVTILGELGVEIENPKVLSLVREGGARISGERAYFDSSLIESALKTAPGGFKLYDSLGRETNDFSGDKVHFTPGSAAINILDYETGDIRRPTTFDYIQYAKLLSRLDNIASQATAFIPADVHEKISDSYRLFLSLLYCEKPVVTGAFTIEAFEVMKDLQLAVRGSEQALKSKPLTMFSCAPTAPLKWSEVVAQNLVDCARYSIPVEYISMPLSGFMAPVTLMGTVIQHCAESLSGVVISQMCNPGTPVLWGGSPAIFDVRYETTPMGAIETMMVDCANSEMGKYLGLPTQAYIALSDSKRLDAQAGLETGIGAVMAALSGINNISGPGMLDFESCQSLEKLVLDNEICAMTFRLINGIEAKEDFPALGLFQELLCEGHLLISEHSRKHLRSEHYFPGPVISRANSARFREEGCLSLEKRANAEVKRLLSEYQPVGISKEIQEDLIRLMEAEGRKYGQSRLPKRVL